MFNVKKYNYMQFLKNIVLKVNKINYENKFIQPSIKLI